MVLSAETWCSYMYSQTYNVKPQVGIVNEEKEGEEEGDCWGTDWRSSL